MAKKSIIKKIDGIPIKQIKADERREERALAIAETQAIEGEVINIPLSDEEREEHKKRIRLILDGMQHIAVTSLEIWEALQWIQANKTYREKYDTFNDFCRDELGKDNSQIYRYIKDAKFKEQLLLAAGTDVERTSIMSLKESNTRFIRTLPEDVQIAFWKLAYGIGIRVLPPKEDGSIEPTTAFLEAVGNSVDEIVDRGGIHLDGQFIPVNKIQAAAEVAGVDETTAKAVLLSVGISEKYFEALKRQEQHIREKSMKADIISLKGNLESKVDINGSDYAVLVDSKGNEYDLNEVLLAYRNRFLHVSIRSPILG